MGEVRVHHLGLAGAPAGIDAAVPLVPAGTITLDGTARPLFAGPNLYLLAGPAEPPAPTPRPVNAPGIAHLCLQTQAGAAIRAALAAAGVRFLSGPVALGTGFLYAYGHDAAGRLIELETAPFLPAAPSAWFGHVAFVSPDGARLARFYAGLLDAEVVAGGRLRDNPRVDAVAGLAGVDVQVWWLRTARFGLEFWQYDRPAHPGPPHLGPTPSGYYTHLGFEADDLAAAAARIGATAGYGRCRAADPDGNRLLLLARGTVPGVAALPDADALPRAAAARVTGR